MKLIPEENECKCPGCGKYFLRYNTSQKYCSVRCKISHPPTYERVCKSCGEKFQSSGSIYCSNKCQRARYAEKRTCSNCGHLYQPTCSTQIYCGPVCRDKATKANAKKGRFIIFERDDFRCFYCGRTSYEDKVKLHVDHVFPVALGGEDKAYNLVTACEECNYSKTDGTTKSQKKLLEEISKRNLAKNIPAGAVIKLYRHNGASEE